MTPGNQRIFDQLPKPDPKLPFSLLTLEEVFVPHQYGMGSEHFAAAHSLRENEAVVAARAEAQGVRCEECQREVYFGAQSKVLPLNEHYLITTLFIKLAEPSEWSQVKGLPEYLTQIKPWTSKAIQALAFVRSRTSWGANG
jgi:hypothetical protein